MYFFVPETRNVALGKDMDFVFGLKEAEWGDDGESATVVEETTALLGRERVALRRASLGSYT